jgi:hypothetical protein
MVLLLFLIIFLFFLQHSSAERKSLLRPVSSIGFDIPLHPTQEIPGSLINLERNGGHHNAYEGWVKLFSEFDDMNSAEYINKQRSLQASATIQLNETFINNGGSVKITAVLPASLVATYGKLAYVALYSPISSNLSFTTPIRYQLCTLDKTFNAAVTNGGQDAVASFTFKLNNLHSGGYVAYLISGGLSGSGVGKGSSSTIKGSDTAWPYGTSGTAVKGGSKPWVSLTGLVGAQDSSSRSPPTVHNFFGTILAKSSTVVNFKKPNEPTGIRISPSSSISPTTLSFRFTWNQNTGSIGGYIKWRSTPPSSWNVIAATSSTISIEDVCARGPAATTGFRDMGTLWTATVDLTIQAGSSIIYIVGDSTDSIDEISPLVFQVPFKLGQASTSSNVVPPQHWIMYADQGVGFDDDSFEGRNYNTGWGARAVATSVARFIQANANGMQGIVISGDASYSDGYIAQWLEWFQMMSSTLSRTPLLLSSGNHESAWFRNNGAFIYDSPSGKTRAQDYWSTTSNAANSISSGGECGVAFKMLPISSATPDKPYYSYSSGLATWVVISTEHSLRPGSQQYSWLVQTLSSVNREQSPWLFLTGHRSMYVFTSNMCGSSNCSNWNPNDPSTDSISDNGWATDQQVNMYLQAFIEPLMIKYSVNFFFSGHTHVTQRYCAVAEGKCKQNSTLDKASGFNVYTLPSYPIGMTIGNAGASTSNDGESEFKSNGGKYPPFHSWLSLDLAYAVISVISPTEANIIVYNAFTGLAIDKSKIIQASRIEASSSSDTTTSFNSAIIAVGSIIVILVLFLGLVTMTRYRTQVFNFAQDWKRRLFRTDITRL